MFSYLESENNNLAESSFNLSETRFPLTPLTDFTVSRVFINSNNNNQINTSISNTAVYFESNVETINRDYDNLSLIAQCSNGVSTSISFPEEQENSISSDENDENVNPKRKRGPIKKEFIKKSESRSKSKYKRTLGISKKVIFKKVLLKRSFFFSIA